MCRNGRCASGQKADERNERDQVDDAALTDHAGSLAVSREVLVYPLARAALKDSPGPANVSRDTLKGGKTRNGFTITLGGNLAPSCNPFRYDVHCSQGVAT